MAADGRCGQCVIEQSPQQIEELLAKASIAKGESSAKKCAACHSFTKGGPNLVGPNVDAVIHVCAAAVAAGVKRVIFASSNHVLGGYKDERGPAKLTPDTPPRPGARYEVQGEQRDSSPYGATKLFGERLGKCYVDMHGLSVIALRIGWVRSGDNLAREVPPERGPWFRMMWLSNRDFCQIVERCIEADASIRFAVLNAMSANTGMRWDIEATRRLIGYEPQDDVTHS